MDDNLVYRAEKAKSHFRELAEVMAGYESVAIIEALAGPVLFIVFLLCLTYLAGKWLKR